jgi:hypothetical protein
MGLKCLTETCYLSAEFLPDSFRTGLDAVRVLEEQMISGIEPDNTSTAQADFELFVRNLRDLLLVRARARALLNRSARASRHMHGRKVGGDRLKSAWKRPVASCL